MSILEKETLQILHLYRAPNFIDKKEDTRPTVIPNKRLRNKEFRKIFDLLFWMFWDTSCSVNVGFISAVVLMFSGIKINSFIGIAHTTKIIVPAKIP